MESVLQAPIGLSMHGSIAVSFTLMGLVLMGALAVYEGSGPSSGGGKVKPAGRGKNFFLEVLISAASSICLGVGAVFLFLWAGIYV